MRPNKELRKLMAKIHMQKQINSQGNKLGTRVGKTGTEPGENKTKTDYAHYITPGGSPPARGRTDGWRIGP